MRRTSGENAGYCYVRATLLLVIVMVTLNGCGSLQSRVEALVPAVSSEPNGEILFVSNNNVFLWDGNISQVTEGGKTASPRWSPDGDRFAYVEVNTEFGYSDLMIAHRDGQLLQQITDHRPDFQPGTEQFVRYAYWASDPAWSPVDNQLTYLTDKDGWVPAVDEPRYSDPMFLWYVESLDIPPYPLRASQNMARPQASPTFSPDGRRLVFTARNYEEGAGRHTEIWTMDLTDGETSLLVPGPAAAYDPAWSPDGDHIAFVRRQGTSNDIWIAPVNGDDPYQLTDTGTAVSPAWSPDGQFLAFFRLADDGRFEAAYVTLNVENGRITASQPQRLFTADNIDTTSGMSWIGTD